MGIRFYCPNGHKLNVKAFQAGRKGICPYCGAKIQIPLQSTRQSGKASAAERQPPTEAAQAAATSAGFSAAPTETTGLATGSVSTGAQVPAEHTAEPSLPVRSVASAPVTPLPSSAGGTPQQSAPVSPVPAAESPPTAPQSAMAAAGIAGTVPANSVGTAPAGPAPSAAVPPDPLSEGGDVVWYVRPPSGGQYGPASPDVMRGWIEQGRVSADSLVWREGWRDWQEAGTMFPQLGAGQETSPFGQLLPGVGGQAAASGAVPASQRARSRRRSQIIQAGTITILVVAVALLLVVFLWVLHTGEPPPEDSTRATAPATAAHWAPEACHPESL